MRRLQLFRAGRGGPIQNFVLPKKWCNRSEPDASDERLRMGSRPCSLRISGQLRRVSPGTPARRSRAGARRISPAQTLLRAREAAATRSATHRTNAARRPAIPASARRKTLRSRLRRSSRARRPLDTRSWGVRRPPLRAGRGRNLPHRERWPPARCRSDSFIRSSRHVSQQLRRRSAGELAQALSAGPRPGDEERHAGERRGAIARSTRLYGSSRVATR